MPLNSEKVTKFSSKKKFEGMRKFPVRAILHATQFHFTANFHIPFAVTFFYTSMVARTSIEIHRSIDNLCLQSYQKVKKELPFLTGCVVTVDIVWHT